MEDDLGWVAKLDVDDTDIVQLSQARPSQRPRIIQPPQVSTSTHQTTEETQYYINPAMWAPSPGSTYASTSNVWPSRNIPGPVGILFEARRRAQADRDEARLLPTQDRHEDLLKSTQEYFRAIVEKPEDDDSFEQLPWLSAMAYAYPEGGNSKLGHVCELPRYTKIDKVVGVVKACEKTEMGELRVILKDTTGSLPGTIHHKITQDEHYKGISVGCVLVLVNLSCFSPDRRTFILNITRKNLLKVFYKDGSTS